MAPLHPGDDAPDFALLDQAGRTVRRSDFAGRKLLIYFYPRAGTPGCTRQACAVRDAGDELERAGVATVGISPDVPERQARFDRRRRLGFPLLSDPDHTVAEAYGAWGPKSFLGKAYQGTIRSSFLIDEDGKIAAAWYRVRPRDTVPNVLAALQRGL
jgi:peroxiredoxin Q/BCP